MKKIQVLLCGLILTTTTIKLQAQTTFRLELIAEGNFGSTNGDVFVRNTMVNPATTSAGMYQTANSTIGFNVLQDYVIAGNKAILAEKPNGAGRIAIVNYPSMTLVQTFAQAPQNLGVASPTKAYACYAQGGVVSLIDLMNNTLTPVIEPNNEITTYSNHMKFANGFMYVDQGQQLVKIDTITNTVVAKFNPGVGSIAGITYDNQGKLWVIGGTNLVSIDVLNADALGTPVNLGVSGKLLRYYNNKLYFWTLSNKKLFQYDIVTPPVLPLTAVYTSLLTGSWDFGYGRSFDVDQTTGDFVIATASAFTGPSGYEVVDGATFTLIESGSIAGCIGANKCVLKTFHQPTGPAPVPDQASLSTVSGQCSATVIAPTADNGVVTGTTSNPTSYTSQGTYTITWTFTNGNGTTTQTQSVVVDDTTDPLIPILNDATGTCSVTPIAPTTIDNCAGTITGTTATAFPITTIGTTEIEWTFNDGNGNSITVTQDIVVTDNTAPVATSLSSLNIACNDVITTIPTATDNCAGTITATTTDPLTYATPGTYTIDWVFADGNGNTANESQTVVVSCSSAGLGDLTTSDLLIYPIPASNSLNIESVALGGELAIVYDAQGQKVLETSLESAKSTLNISALVNGFYFLKVGNSSARFVVSK
ncbi:T9SS type A sorting domain-containing protein [Fluviicola taffensis]|uniref:Secretion system C-terminal sorting domain-containing protein n=1 Tax=Fluviicola taffensis (strain DSM 16823 / NCIMB 13979 / RW262) TaxID=755732 RepID=F2IG82_FLUTR|nr:T9SS type A sorting domain-containing protein [Fluviicola taffensis]AEA44717.1 hypothetical protein Fluta_2736 [Fluviicola taffensis DSM 16823]